MSDIELFPFVVGIGEMGFSYNGSEICMRLGYKDSVVRPLFPSEKLILASLTTIV